MKKRNVLSAITVAMIVFSCSAFICNAETIANGNCGANGDNVVWSINTEKVLTISGNGEMEDGDNASYRDYLFADEEYVNKIVIEEGVTSI